jgi:dihydroorotate dehydrogenase electron transfer subunit
MSAPFGRRRAAVLANSRLGPYDLIDVADDGPPPLPGQFYMLASVERWGGGDRERPLLGRAVSVARAPGDGTLSFMLEDVGPGTGRLCALSPGEQLWLVGPLGHGFEPPAEDVVLLLGGGVGIAPLAMAHERWGGTPLLGFRDGAHASAASLLPNAQLATDDGSHGHAGYVTDLLLLALSGEQPVCVLACGPPAMLDATLAIVRARDVSAQLCLEAPMACGFGACYGCVVATLDGYRRVCLDGPVFDARALA